MIRINLLAVERQKATHAPVFDAGRRIMLACCLVLVAGGGAIGAWYWSLSQASARVDEEIVIAQQEAARLRTITAEVQRFEQRRQQIQQRVALIQQLRGGQSVPVEMLDRVSRSIPDMLWLTDLDQAGPEVTLRGRATTLIALSDFVGNLGSQAFFKKPIEIVDSQVENAVAATATMAPADLITFTVKAQLATAPSTEGPAPAGAPKR